jgi:hypothetical protein
MPDNSYWTVGDYKGAAWKTGMRLKDKKGLKSKGSQISSENRHSNLIGTSQSKINPFKISFHAKKNITF